MVVQDILTFHNQILWSESSVLCFQTPFLCFLSCSAYLLALLFWNLCAQPQSAHFHCVKLGNQDIIGDIGKLWWKFVNEKPGKVLLNEMRWPLASLLLFLTLLPSPLLPHNLLPHDLLPHNLLPHNLLERERNGQALGSGSQPAAAAAGQHFNFSRKRRATPCPPPAGHYHHHPHHHHHHHHPAGVFLDPRTEVSMVKTAPSEVELSSNILQWSTIISAKLKAVLCNVEQWS